MRQHLKYRKVSESYVNSEWQINISRISLSQWTCAWLRGPRRAALCWKPPWTRGINCRWGEHSSQCLGIDISWPFYRAVNANNKCASNVANKKDSKRLEISIQKLWPAIFQLHKCQLIFWLNRSLRKSLKSELKKVLTINSERPIVNHIPCHKHNEQSYGQLSFVNDTGLRT